MLICPCVLFQEFDSPPSSSAAVQLHPLSLTSVHSVIQMAADPRAAHPAGLIHTTPQVGLCCFFVFLTSQEKHKDCFRAHQRWEGCANTQGTQIMETVRAIYQKAVEQAEQNWASKAV